MANISWKIKKAKEFQKNIHFCFIDYAKAFDCVDHNKLWKIQLELDMEQQTGFKQEKEYVKAVFCHPAYLTSMNSTT